MRWSFRFGRVFGIDLKVHFTFLLVVLIGAMNGLRVGGNLGALFGIAAVLLLFTCVLLHELGHSVVAIRLGVPVREIIMLPIGGVAMLSRSPRRGRDELLIAVAGPAVNVVILIFLVPLLLLVPGGPSGVGQLGQMLWVMRHGGVPRLPALPLMLLILTQANLMLILFNMIPAFPLDGGRVLRALLWMRMPMARATRLAANVGQVFAVLLGLYGLFGGGGLFMTVIAFFIFMGAGAEAAAAQTHAVLSTRRVGDAYNRYALALSIDDRVSRVIEYVLSSYQPDFAVVHRGKLQGVVTRDDVLKWLSANDYDVFVTEVMHDDVLRVDARLPLEEVLQRMQDADRRLAAVFDGETYLGLVSAEDIAEAQLVLTFLQRGPGSAPTAGTHRIRPATTTEPVV